MKRCVGVNDAASCGFYNLHRRISIQVALSGIFFEDAAFSAFDSDVDFVPEQVEDSGEAELFVDLFDDDLLDVAL